MIARSVSSVLLGVALVFCACGTLVAQPGRDKDPLSWDRKIQRLFSRNCYRCHGNSDPSGDVNLARDEDPRLILEHRKTWVTALEMLRSDQMPPPGEGESDHRQPNDEERQWMVDFLDRTLNSLDCESVDDPGRSVMRRLNRTEYNNAVFDLTGLPLDLADQFPPDPTSYGFDNIGDSLTLTPAQVEIYHAAAKTIVSELLKTKRHDPEVFTRTFFEKATETPLREHAHEVLRRFATQAFRRPVDVDYVERLLKIYDKAVARAQVSDPTHDQAIGHAMTAVLMSPRFLIRIEVDHEDASEPSPVSDYELASRLSFFLWSRPPDEPLLSIAEAGHLHDPEVLKTQVARMLKDERSTALVENFFFQWLDLRNLDQHTPDPNVFPEFDDELREAMGQEVRLLISDIVRNDLSLTHLIDADFTYVNQRLAKHYGIEGVTSSEPQRVSLTDKRRGGILTSAALVMLQADPGRTNIPRRGNFIAAQFLGDAAPPPPPNVPPLKVVDDGKERSLRETFELHRNSPICKGCHAKIDPLGFSLENYDAIGRWRDQENGIAIDASAKPVSGDAFNGPAGLKAYVRSRQDEFLQTVATKLMIYALGRGLQTSDECVVNDMVEASNANDLRLSSLIQKLVAGKPFTHRRNPDY